MKLIRLLPTVALWVVAAVLVVLVLWLSLPVDRPGIPNVIQACAVILSLTVATVVFLRDSRDKRTDRVHQLHRELTTGDIGDARARLGHFLRAHGEGETVKVVAVKDLEIGNALGAYDKEDEGHHPRRDVALVLHFFERARIAQSDGAVLDRPFAELVGYHASWWARAIEHKGNELTYSVHALAFWADDYIAKREKRDPELSILTKRREKDFPLRKIEDPRLYENN